jgi:deoxyribose-phosphate aldolase
MEVSSPARLIDHTLLRPDARESEIRQLCQEAIAHHLMAVCVNPTWIELVATLLKGSDSLPITVTGFPLGASTSKNKALETEEAILLGAQEIDTVMNIGLAKDGRWKAVEADLREVVKGAGIIPVKVIIETGFLSTEEVVAACKASVAAGAAFVKTSTGFGPRGASVEDIRTMRATVGPDLGVKASGGIRDADLFRKMVLAGASRVGSSSSVKILGDLKK